MTDFAALKTIWPSFTGTTTDKLEQLNALTSPGPLRDVPFDEIMGYCNQNGLLAKLRDLIANPKTAKSGQSLIAANYLLALLADPDRRVLLTSQPDTLAQATTFLTMLMADPVTGFTADHVAALLAKTTTTQPWWQASGFDKAIGVGDLIAAGNLF